MIDVFKCLKLDASLLLGQGWQSDWLKKKKAFGRQGDFEQAAEILNVFFFLLEDHCHIAWAVIGMFQWLRIPAVIMDLVHEMPIVWPYLFWGLLLFVSLTELTCRTRRNYWDFSVEIVLGFDFNMKWLHIHNFQNSWLYQHTVVR